MFQLIELGKIQLDTIVSDILPELANPVIVNENPGPGEPSFRPTKGEITLMQLLNHSSGLASEPQGERVVDYALPSPITSSHDKENPVSHFYSLTKV